MKGIKAIIQPHMLCKVMDALHALPRLPGVTLSDCLGQSLGRCAGGQYVATAPSESSFSVVYEPNMRVPDSKGEKR